MTLFVSTFLMVSGKIIWMKIFFLLIFFISLYSFNSFSNEFDDKLKRKYEELQKIYPNGEELYCTWYVNEGGVIWDIHEIYYVVEKSNKIFAIWRTDKGANGEKNVRLLLGNDLPIQIIHSSKNNIIWNINDIIFAYKKESKQLIIDFDKKNNFIRINKLKIGMLPKNFRLMNCRYKYNWP